MNITERFDRLDTMLRKGRVIRNSWTEGQERACLLAAISPEAGAKGSAEACPASVIPPWLAYLTPNMDDSGTLEAWPGFVRRYADVVRRAALTLGDAGWRRAMFGALHCIVTEAMSHTDDETALPACRRVVELIARGQNGDVAPDDDWAAARSAAWSAAWSAAESAARSAAESAAWSAARSAAWSAARSAAWSAAWDRLNTGILDAIEREVGRVALAKPVESPTPKVPNE